MSNIPDILHRVEIIPDYCLEMADKRIFKTPNSRILHDIKLNRTNLIEEVEVGEFEMKDDSVTCTGEKVHVGNHVYTDVVRVAQYHVLVKPVEFLVKGTVVEVEEDHLLLSCNVNNRGCQTGEGTYSWEVPPTDCPLEFVQEVRLSKDDNLYLDHHNKLVFNVTGKTKIPNCPDEYLATTIKDIVLTGSDSETHYQALLPEDIKTELQFSVRLTYLHLQVEKQLNGVNRQLRSLMCTSKLQKYSDKPIQIQDNNFGLHNGDLFLTFNCVKRTADIASLETCHHDIPILRNGNVSFVDPVNRVFIPFSAVQSCRHRFPLTIKSNEGWVELSPQIKIRANPLSVSPVLTDPENQSDLDDYTYGGLYTTDEINSWRDLIAFPTYHQATLKTVTLGTCLQDETCSAYSNAVTHDKYDLSRLIPIVQEVEHWTTELHKWIISIGAYTSFLVLMIIGFRVITDVIIILVTATTGGASATIAILIQMYGSSIQSYRKVMKKRRKFKAQQRVEGQFEPVAQVDPI